MSLPIPKVPWHSISMDFITKLPESNSYDSILVVCDHFRKMVHFISCNETITAEETAKLLVNYVIKLHGLPSEIISDRGPQFISDTWKSILYALQITRKLSSTYHPQTDRQSEQSN